ncbi:hypothetical protein GCM10017083_10090 [Thalassobaculum fulvum]|uniref:DUF4347 domain-containing protein n=1 Tax=Thalassobaculum fulvum TaxID=1633335 RepID=A0A919CNF9_9PROT|nr:DUF4347 domain-containing protein [Thalassobaculum fulvum]GHD43658.1 hypothetical protein GCM10017083_10090 [Thalassobaculum fulvum]
MEEFIGDRGDSLTLERAGATAGQGPGAGPVFGGEVLIVDPGVPVSTTLVDGRRPGIDVVRLADGGRGLEQIAERLVNRRAIAVLHVLCRGEPGAVVLAGDRVDLPALAMRRGVLADISQALGDSAVVALYGSSVASGAVGLRFLDYLETVLGVAVAASAGPVGSAAQGGRWTLRDRHGTTIETAFPAISRATYPLLLAGGR